MFSQTKAAVVVTCVLLAAPGVATASRATPGKYKGTFTQCPVVSGPSPRRCPGQEATGPLSLRVVGGSVTRIRFRVLLSCAREELPNTVRITKHLRIARDGTFSFSHSDRRAHVFFSGRFTGPSMIAGRYSEHVRDATHGECSTAGPARFVARRSGRA